MARLAALLLLTAGLAACADQDSLKFTMSHADYHGQQADLLYATADTGGAGVMIGCPLAAPVRIDGRLTLVPSAPCQVYDKAWVSNVKLGLGAINTGANVANGVGQIMQGEGMIKSAHAAALEAGTEAASSTTSTSAVAGDGILMVQETINNNGTTAK